MLIPTPKPILSDRFNPPVVLVVVVAVELVGLSCVAEDVIAVVSGGEVEVVSEVVKVAIDDMLETLSMAGAVEVAVIVGIKVSQACKEAHYRQTGCPCSAWCRKS